MAGGYEPDENENGQLLHAIKAIIADNIPPEKVRTTLAEYGIIDAYTKNKVYTREEIDELLNGDELAVLVGLATEIKQGTARFGTPEEQVAGLLKTVMSNPAGMLALLAAWFPKRVFLGNDYIRLPDLPGGLIIQWGTASIKMSAGGVLTQNLPIAFPSAFLYVVPFYNYTVATVSMVHTASILNNSQFSVKSWSSEGSTPSYIAIGS